MNKKKLNKHLKSIAANGGAASMKKLSKKQRSDKARRAARARWMEKSHHTHLIDSAMERIK